MTGVNILRPTFTMLGFTPFFSQCSDILLGHGLLQGKYVPLWTILKMSCQVSGEKHR